MFRLFVAKQTEGLDPVWAKTVAVISTKGAPPSVFGKDNAIELNESRIMGLYESGYRYLCAPDVLRSCVSIGVLWGQVINPDRTFLPFPWWRPFLAEAVLNNIIASESPDLPPYLSRIDRDDDIDSPPTYCLTPPASKW